MLSSRLWFSCPLLSNGVPGNAFLPIEMRASVCDRLFCSFANAGSFILLSSSAITVNLANGRPLGCPVHPLQAPARHLRIRLFCIRSSMAVHPFPIHNHAARRFPQQQLTAKLRPRLALLRLCRGRAEAGAGKFCRAPRCQCSRSTFSSSAAPLGAPAWHPSAAADGSSSCTTGSFD